MKNLYTALCTLFLISNSSIAQDNDIFEKAKKIVISTANTVATEAQKTGSKIKETSYDFAKNVQESAFQGVQELQKQVEVLTEKIDPRLIDRMNESLDDFIEDEFDIQSSSDVDKTINIVLTKKQVQEVIVDKLIPDTNTLVDQESTQFPTDQMFPIVTPTVQNDTQEVAVLTTPRYSEKDGYIWFYTYKIFDTASDRAYIEEQRAKTSEDDLKKMSERKTSQQVDAALLAAWKKDHPVVLTTFDKVIASGLFTSIVAAFVGYYHWNNSNDQDDDQQDNDLD